MGVKKGLQNLPSFDTILSFQKEVVHNQAMEDSIIFSIVQLYFFDCFTLKENLGEVAKSEEKM